MTREELEKEARINLKRRFGEFFPQLTISYVMGAEPREKRIAELEAQIEKAKGLLNILLGQMIEGALHTPTILEVNKFLEETE